MKNNPIGSRSGVKSERVYYNQQGQLIHSYTNVSGYTEYEYIKPDFKPGFSKVDSLKVGNFNCDIYKFCSKTGEVSYYAKSGFYPTKNIHEIDWNGQTDFTIGDVMDGSKSSDGFRRTWHPDTNQIEVHFSSSSNKERASEYEVGGYPLLKNYCMKNNVTTGTFYKVGEPYRSSKLYYDAEGNLHHETIDGEIDGDKYTDKVVEKDYKVGMHQHGNVIEFCTENGEKTYYDQNGQQLKYAAQYDKFVPYYTEDGLVRTLDPRNGTVEITVPRVKTMEQTSNVTAQPDMGPEMGM